MAIPAIVENNLLLCPHCGSPETEVEIDAIVRVEVLKVEGREVWCAPDGSSSYREPPQRRVFCKDCGDTSDWPEGYIYQEGLTGMPEFDGAIAQANLERLRGQGA
jgi:hypothetical protein